MPVPGTVVPGTVAPRTLVPAGAGAGHGPDGQQRIGGRQRQDRAARQGGQHGRLTGRHGRQRGRLVDRDSRRRRRRRRLVTRGLVFAGQSRRPAWSPSARPACCRWAPAWASRRRSCLGLGRVDLRQQLARTIAEIPQRVWPVQLLCPVSRPGGLLVILGFELAPGLRQHLDRFVAIVAGTRLLDVLEDLLGLSSNRPQCSVSSS